MKLARLLLMTIGFCLPVSALACDNPMDDSIVVQHSNDTAACTVLFDKLDYLFEELRDLDVFTDDSPQVHDYWTEWTYAIAEEPMITSQIAKNKLGIGFWSPNDLSPEEYDDYEEWLRDQGVHLTLGVGGHDKESLRFRLDYQWHQSRKGGVVMQFEMPF
jgi:hypothetical protein